MVDGLLIKIDDNKMKIETFIVMDDGKPVRLGSFCKESEEEFEKMADLVDMLVQLGSIECELITV